MHQTRKKAPSTRERSRVEGRESKAGQRGRKLRIPNTKIQKAPSTKHQREDESRRSRVEGRAEGKKAPNPKFQKSEGRGQKAEGGRESKVESQARRHVEGGKPSLINVSNRRDAMNAERKAAEYARSPNALRVLLRLTSARGGPKSLDEVRVSALCGRDVGGVRFGGRRLAAMARAGTQWDFIGEREREVAGERPKGALARFDWHGLLLDSGESRARLYDGECGRARHALVF